MTVRYLSTETLVDIAMIAVGRDVVVRDIGLLESAAARPQTSVFGQEAYTTVLEKAAALLHSIVSNHPLLDGNKRLGFTACATFLAHNGIGLREPDEIEDTAYDLVIDVASGAVTTVDAIAKRLADLVVAE
jgi:death on curing protein